MKRDRILFRMSCIMFGISAFSILLTFLGDYNGNSASVFFAIMTGVLFWGCLIAGILLLLVVNSHRKKRRRFINGRRMEKSKCGALSFFSNRTAAIFDIAMVVFLLLVVLSMLIPLISQSVTLILFAFLLFSVYMHSMFNGVNFTYINSKNEECRE